MYSGFPCVWNAGDLGLIPGLGRFPGEGKCYPLQFSGLENSMNCIVHGCKELDTTERLSLSLSMYIDSWRTDAMARHHAVVVQMLSSVWLFVTPWTVAHQASLSITMSWSLLKFMSIELMMKSNYLILCCPLLLPSIFPRLSGSFPMSWLVCIR